MPSSDRVRIIVGESGSEWVDISRFVQSVQIEANSPHLEAPPETFDARLERISTEYDLQLGEGWRDFFDNVDIPTPDAERWFPAPAEELGACWRCEATEAVASLGLCASCKTDLGDDTTGPLTPADRTGAPVRYWPFEDPADDNEPEFPTYSLDEWTAPAPTFDPGSCPLCGGRDYDINWLDVGGYNLTRQIPGSVSCRNPDCPPR